MHLPIEVQHVHGAHCGHQHQDSVEKQSHESHSKKSSHTHNHHHAAQDAQQQLGHICNGGCSHGEKKTAQENSAKDTASSSSKTTVKPSQNSGEKGSAAQTSAQTKSGQTPQENVPTKKPTTQGFNEGSTQTQPQTYLQKQSPSPRTIFQNPSHSSNQTPSTQQQTAKFLFTSPQPTKANAGTAKPGSTNSSSTSMLHASSLSASILSGQQALPASQAQSLANPSLLGLNGFVQGNSQMAKNLMATLSSLGYSNFTTNFSQSTTARPTPLKLSQGLAQEASFLSKNIPLNPLAFQSMGALLNSAGTMVQTGIFATLSGNLKNLTSLLFGQYRFVANSQSFSKEHEALLQSLSALLAHTKKRKSQKKLKKKDLIKVHKKDTLCLEEIFEGEVAKLESLERNKPLPALEKSDNVGLWQSNQPIALEKNLSKNLPGNH